MYYYLSVSNGEIRSQCTKAMGWDALWLVSTKELFVIQFYMNTFIFFFFWYPCVLKDGYDTITQRAAIGGLCSYQLLRFQSCPISSSTRYILRQSSPRLSYLCHSSCVLVIVVDFILFILPFFNNLLRTSHYFFLLVICHISLSWVFRIMVHYCNIMLVQRFINKSKINMNTGTSGQPTL